MREIFKAQSGGDSDRLFFFSKHELGGLLGRYARAVPQRAVRDYCIDGNSQNIVTFSMLKDARSNDAPVLSLTKKKGKGGAPEYILYSRAHGARTETRGSFLKLMDKLDKELLHLEAVSHENVVSLSFAQRRLRR